VKKVRLNKLATAFYDFTVRKAVYISGLIDSFFNGTSSLGVYNNTDLCISTLLCNFSTYMPNMQDKGQNFNTKKD
jgi:hypothetical protein